MVDAKAQVFAGQEGSGLAQIVDTTRLAQYYQGVQKQKAAVDLEKMKRRNKALDDFSKQMDKMATPSYLHQDEFFQMSNSWRDSVSREMAMNPEAIYDPTSGISKMVREGQKAEELYAAQSKYVEEQYNKMLEAVNNPEFRQDILKDRFSKMSGAKSMKEQYALVSDALVPDLNEMEILNKITPQFIDTTYENEAGVKTRTKKASEDSARVQAIAFFNTGEGKRYLDSGKADGLWGNTEEAVNWVVDKRMSQEDVITSTTREGQGGLEFNFGAGGNKADYGDWSAMFYQGKNKMDIPTRTGEQPYTDGIVKLDLSYKKKNVPALTFSGDGDVVERGYIDRVEIDPNNPEKSEVVIKSASKLPEDSQVTTENIDRLPTIRLSLNDDNKATILNTIGIDIDAELDSYMRANKLGKYSVGANTKKEELTTQENKGAKGKWGSRKSNIEAQ